MSQPRADVSKLNVTELVAGAPAVKLLVCLVCGLTDRLGSLQRTHRRAGLDCYDPRGHTGTLWYRAFDARIPERERL